MKCSECGEKMKFLGLKTGIEWRDNAVITQKRWVCLKYHEIKEIDEE